MGLLQEDLARYRSVYAKHASIRESGGKIDPVEILRSKLAEYAGMDLAAEKNASADDHGRLYRLHREVEEAYRVAVKVGKRLGANALLDKFSGWRYLKGQPGEPGDLTPFPVPEKS